MQFLRSFYFVIFLNKNLIKCLNLDIKALPDIYLFILTWESILKAKPSASKYQYFWYLSTHPYLELTFYKTPLKTAFADLSLNLFIFLPNLMLCFPKLCCVLSVFPVFCTFVRL